jgi:hypothetical protein
MLGKKSQEDSSVLNKYSIHHSDNNTIPHKIGNRGVIDRLRDSAEPTASFVNLSNGSYCPESKWRELVYNHDKAGSNITGSVESRTISVL